MATQISHLPVVLVEFLIYSIASSLMFYGAISMIHSCVIFQSIVFWDIRTGNEKRSFAPGESAQWPVFKYVAFYSPSLLW